MKIFACSIVAMLAFCLVVNSAGAQDALAEFRAVDAEWQDIDGQIEKLIERFKASSAEDQPAVIKEYEALAERSRNLVPKLRVTAVASYTADPKADPHVEEILVSLIANDVRMDKYESALELGELLVANDCQEPAVDTFIGVAAYCIDDFAKAESHLTKAKAANALTQEGAIALNDLPTAIEAWTVEQATRAREAAADDLPRVKFETSKGAVVIELYENEAPQTVGNFVSLVESGFYNGLTFHRVLPNFMAQGGCPDGTGGGGPGYDIACECYRDDYRKHFRGTLSMAHAGRDTGGSQFFLTFRRTSHLDGKHTVFGRVIEGLDVLAKLQRRDPSQQGQLPEPDRIIKAEIIRKRDHEYMPTKVGR